MPKECKYTNISNSKSEKKFMTSIELEKKIKKPSINQALWETVLMSIFYFAENSRNWNPRLKLKVNHIFLRTIYKLVSVISFSFSKWVWTSETEKTLI